ncbi:MAG: translation elongation factor Ts [Candidatus Firestonebacteria bacterium]
MDISKIKDLREKTGAGIVECKEALNSSNDDLEKAFEYLRKKGISKALKKVGREASEGIVTSYIHMGGKIGVLLEINCETDFVARTDDFKELAKDIAMQVAASNPLYIKREDVPANIIDKEKEIYKAEAKNAGKPDKILDKIAEGKLGKFFSEVCLLEQAFIKDPDKKVSDIITQKIVKLGENIIVRRFTRYVLGEKY